jgi:phospholipase C
MKFALGLTAGAAVLASTSAIPHGRIPRPRNLDVWGQLRNNVSASLEYGAWRSFNSKYRSSMYLIMENRSFDNIAGYWNFRDDIDGLIGETYCNE